MEKGRARMFRLLVADDHEIVRKGLVKVLTEILQPNQGRRGDQRTGSLGQGLVRVNTTWSCWTLRCPESGLTYEGDQTAQGRSLPF